MYLSEIPLLGPSSCPMETFHCAACYTPAPSTYNQRQSSAKSAGAQTCLSAAKSAPFVRRRRWSAGRMRNGVSIYCSRKRSMSVGRGCGRMGWLTKREKGLCGTAVAMIAVTAATAATARTAAIRTIEPSPFLWRWAFCLHSPLLRCGSSPSMQHTSSSGQSPLPRLYQSFRSLVCNSAWMRVPLPSATKPSCAFPRMRLVSLHSTCAFAPPDTHTPLSPLYWDTTSDSCALPPATTTPVSAFRSTTQLSFISNAARGPCVTIPDRCDRETVQACSSALP